VAKAQQANEGGGLTAGLWYGESEGVSINLDLKQPRVFGSDENVSLQVHANKYSNSFMVLTVDPDFFDSPYSRTIEASAYSVTPNSVQGGDYSYSGLDLVLGFERDLVRGLIYGFGLGAQKLSLDSSVALPDAVADYVTAYSETTDTVLGYVSVSYDRTHGGERPTSGYRLSNLSEIGLTSGGTYLKTEIAGERYLDLGRGYNLRAHGRLAHGAGLGGNALPIFKNYYGGGIGSLRGFAEGSLGPVSAIPNSADVAHIGGATALFGGLEVSRSLRRNDDLVFSAFFDFGNVFGEEDSRFLSQMRKSVGVAVNWNSPLGPISVVLAKPLNLRDGDREVNLQFSFGRSF
jgi:outer membrane protein insertion porin family